MVIRLGVRPPEEGLAGAGYRRILQGQTLTLHTISDAVVTLRTWVRVIYDDGSGQLLTIPETPRSGSRVAEALASTDVVTQNGWVVNAEVEMLTDDIKRGQTYVRLAVEPFGCVLLQDYCFSGFGPVSLGTFTQPGPGGGGGNLAWVTVKADGAPAATTTYALALSNALRLVRGFVWYYASSGTAANRVMRPRLRDVGGSVPTGYTIGGANDFWVAADITLTADQDGMMFADPQRSGTKDAAVLSIDDQASAPTPFPLLVPEGDTAILVFILVDGEVDDFDVIYVQIEDWVLL